jgi:thioredoxin-dependent peroxiredoxin
MPSIGEQAPDFELPNQDGKMVKLSDFRGKKVIIFAYPRAFTGGCTTQACGFRDRFPQIETGNAVVLGLSDDPQNELKRWKAHEKLPYDLLSDVDHQVLEQWGAWGEKNNFGKVSVGTIRSHWVIDEKGTLIDQHIKISPEDSVAEALKVVTGA